MYRLLLLATLLHLGLALSVHLSPDEAHYALYASHLDWSYFDHPPLVGWLQWLPLQMGASDLAMRVVPMAAWLATALGLVALGRQLYPQADTGVATVALLALSPLPHLLGFALVPDSLLMALTPWALQLVWRLADANQARRKALWCALGVCLGLCGLSKYTALLTAAAALAVLAWAHGLRLALLPGPWLTALVALALISPVLAWNASHSWVSFAYQLGHAAGSAPWQAWRLVAFGLVQLLVFGAALPVGLWIAWRLNYQHGGRASAATKALTGGRMFGLAGRPLSALGLCLAFGLPTLMLLLKLSGRGSTLPHWAAPAWVALMPAAAAGALALHTQWPRLARVGMLAMAASVAGMVVLMVSGGPGSERGAQATSEPGVQTAETPRNPVADLYGWDLAARQAKTLAKAHGVRTLAVGNWSLASRIAWYARPLPIKVWQTHQNQFQLWFQPLRPGDDVLLVDWSLMSYDPPVGPDRFRHCQRLAQQPVWHLGRQLAHFNFSICRGWQGPRVALPGQTLPPT